MLAGLFSCCFLFLFSEVQKQSDILSGQAGDTAEGTTMELPACLMGTTSSLEQRRTAETHPFFFLMSRLFKDEREVRRRRVVRLRVYCHGKLVKRGRGERNLSAKIATYHSA